MKRRTGQDGDVDDCNARQQQQQQQQQQDGVDDTNDGENIFSRALFNLSFNDRNQIEEEMHGVSCMAIDETPELLEESLYQFDLELDLIDENNKVAYNKAQEIIQSEEDPLTHSFILSKEVKLRFLRSELFDPRKSASRFTKYIDLLFDLYGECALRRPIQLQDLNLEELTFLKSGQNQLLPYRDRSGRRILSIIVNNKEHVPFRVRLKVYIYINFISVGGSDTSNNDRNNVETQRKGIVVVAYSINLSNSNENDNENNNNELAYIDRMERMKAYYILGKVVPQRMAAMHICLPNVQIFGVVASFYGIAFKLFNARTSIHARTKLYAGNPIEIRYKLQQHGIPIELLPITDTWNIKLVNLNQWIKLCKHLEREKQYSSDSDNSNSGGGYDSGGVSATSSTITTTTIENIVECPLSNDVVFRRGKPLNFHVGNVNFQNLIESRIYEHTIDQNTPPLRRTEIEIEIFNEVFRKPKQGESGRFLTWNKEKKWWLVIHSENEIQLKIRNAFRDFRKKMLRTQQQQQKVQTISNSNSLFEQQQQDGQKKKFKNNNNSCCSDCGLYCGNASDANNNGCNNIMPCVPSTMNNNGNNNNNNNNNAFGYFFSTDDGSYACISK